MKIGIDKELAQAEKERLQAMKTPLDGIDQDRLSHKERVLQAMKDSETLSKQFLKSNFEKNENKEDK